MTCEEYRKEQGISERHLIEEAVSTTELEQNVGEKTDRDSAPKLYYALVQSAKYVS